MSTTQPIRDKKQVKELADYYLKNGRLRNYVLIIMGIHTALRIGDLLALRWGDVYDFGSGAFRGHIRLCEKKTGKEKAVALNRRAADALKRYYATLDGCGPESFIFAGNRKKHAPISRVQAYRIIKDAAYAIGMEGSVSCHSLRKTFGYHAWKSGVPVAVIMEIYNHSSFEVTRRYLGVCQDDKDKVYLDMRFA